MVSFDQKRRFVRRAEIYVTLVLVSLGKSFIRGFITIIRVKGKGETIQRDLTFNVSLDFAYVL